MKQPVEFGTALAILFAILVVAFGALWYAFKLTDDGMITSTGSSASSTVQISTASDTTIGGTTGTSTMSASGTVVYTNNQYGFTLTLPSDWQGYTVATTTWTGTEINCDSDTCPTETGPELMVRNPQWTVQNQWQPIPIMVFTTAEWTAVSQENEAVGAAPIPPSELGSNDMYVFALPARYNYAYTEGWQEVQAILQGNPLQGFNP